MRRLLVVCAGVLATLLVVPHAPLAGYALLSVLLAAVILTHDGPEPDHVGLCGCAAWFVMVVATHADPDRIVGAYGILGAMAIAVAICVCVCVARWSGRRSPRHVVAHA